jgi:hypothetical protein
MNNTGRTYGFKLQVIEFDGEKSCKRTWITWEKCHRRQLLKQKASIKKKREERDDITTETLSLEIDEPLFSFPVMTPVPGSYPEKSSDEDMDSPMSWE